MFTSRSLYLPFTASKRKDSINSIRTDFIIPSSVILRGNLEFNLKIYSALPLLCENNTSMMMNLKDDASHSKSVIFDSKKEFGSIPIKIGMIRNKSIKKVTLSLKVSPNSCDSIYNNYLLDPVQVIFFKIKIS